jgi:hypothetical protein
MTTRERTVRHRTTARVLPVNSRGELHEETGLTITAADLGDPVAHGVVEFDWGLWHLVQEQTFFAFRLDDASGLHFDGLEPLERGTIDQAAWWSPDALDADGSAAGGELTAIMRVAVKQILGEA